MFFGFDVEALNLATELTSSLNESKHEIEHVALTLPFLAKKNGIVTKSCLQVVQVVGLKILFVFIYKSYGGSDFSNFTQYDFSKISITALAKSSAFENG